MEEEGTYFIKRKVIRIKFQNFVKIFSQIKIKNYYYDMYIVLYVPELPVFFPVSLSLSLLYVHCNLVTVRLWSDF